MVYFVQVDDCHDNLRERFHRFLCKLNHRSEELLAINLHQIAVLLRIGGVETNGNGIDESDQLRNDVPLIDDIAVTVGIEAGLTPMLLDPS